MQSLEFQRFGIHEDRHGVRTVTSSLHVDPQTPDKEKLLGILGVFKTPKFKPSGTSPNISQTVSSTINQVFRYMNLCGTSCLLLRYFSGVFVILERNIEFSRYQLDIFICSPKYKWLLTVTWDALSQNR